MCKNVSFPVTVFSSLALGVSSLSAFEVGKKPTDTPQLPNAPYVVHDGTRPQPRVVENVEAVEIKPPGDAIVLFDGTSLDAFWHEEGKKQPFELREDGVMVAAENSMGTQQQFRDIQFHLEWRIPADRETKGQGGGNSGIFFMGLYELQILQSHDNQTYPDGQATALYGQAPPLVNATAPKGEWQSYDGYFKAPVYKDGKLQSPATITALHNGVIVHAGKAYLGPTAYKSDPKYPDTHPEKGPIRLQFHGDPVEFRNIWVRELGDYDEEK